LSLIIDHFINATAAAAAVRRVDEADRGISRMAVASCNLSRLQSIDQEQWPPPATARIAID